MLIKRSGVEGLNGTGAVIDRGDDDDHGVRRDAARVLQNIHAGNLRHAHIGDHDIVERGVDLAARLLAAGHRLHPVSLALERNLQHLADGALITDQDIVRDYLLSLVWPGPLITGQGRQHKPGGGSLQPDGRAG